MSAVRGRVWKHGRTWYYEVAVCGVVVMADNTNDFRKILDACCLDVAAVRRIVAAGHRLERSWDELVATS